MFSMWRKTGPARPATTLSHALPTAEQDETHHRVIAAPVEAVWDALTRVTAADLPLARALMRVRRGHLPPAPLLLAGPVPAQHLDAPRYAAGVTAHRPWARRSGPAVDLDSVGMCPSGWVVTGIEFELHPLGPLRTLLSTRTRCHATDARTRRTMRIYWALIGPASGLIRRELLRATAQLATTGHQETRRA